MFPLLRSVDGTCSLLVLNDLKCHQLWIFKLKDCVHYKQESRVIFLSSRKELLSQGLGCINHITNSKKLDEFFILAVDVFVNHLYLYYKLI
jgi:hypothetical protein